jgi:hypothetical protein
LQSTKAVARSCCFQLPTWLGSIGMGSGCVFERAEEEQEPAELVVDARLRPEPALASACSETRPYPGGRGRPRSGARSRPATPRACRARRAAAHGSRHWATPTPEISKVSPSIGRTRRLIVSARADHVRQAIMAKMAITDESVRHRRGAVHQHRKPAHLRLVIPVSGPRL